MTRYQIENACHRIDGYHLPKASQPPGDAFAKAKAECLQQMRQDLADVEAITLDQFQSLHPCSSVSIRG